MRLIEAINDECYSGIGLLVWTTPFDARCVLGVFKNKEKQYTEVHLLFLKIKIEIRIE